MLPWVSDAKQKTILKSEPTEQTSRRNFPFTKHNEYVKPVEMIFESMMSVDHTNRA